MEQSVREGRSVLPVGPCIAQSGEPKQIDAAFRIGNRLLVAECRAVSRSIAFERGDPDAIRYWIQTIEKALTDGDDKGSWLAAHPRGRNYDVTWAEAIVPGVTPFVQFIPSTDQRYWLTDRPRIQPRAATIASTPESIGAAPGPQTWFSTGTE